LEFNVKSEYKRRWQERTERGKGTTVTLTLEKEGRPGRRGREKKKKKRPAWLRGSLNIRGEQTFEKQEKVLEKGDKLRLSREGWAHYWERLKRDRSKQIPDKPYRKKKVDRKSQLFRRKALQVGCGT